MAGYLLRHDLDDDPVLHAGYVLDEPLEFADGEAVVDDEEDARDLARRHTHVEYDGPVQVSPETESQPSEASEEATLPFDPGELTLDELEGALQNVTDIATLEAIRDAEDDGEGRKGALEVIEDRLDAYES